MLKVEDLCMESNQSLLSALKKINANSQGVVFVVEDGTLFGCLTDGDIRRAIIKGAGTEFSVKPFVNKDVIYEHFNAPDKELRRATNIDTKVIPLVDDDKKILDFATLYRPHNVVVMEPFLGGNELNYVTDCVKSNWISSQGAYVTLFEKKLAEFFDVDYCLATSNGTAALHLGLEALGIGSGDEVITTNLTFGASVNSIIHTGAKPVLVDVDKDTWNISPSLIERAITPSTKAIMPVHLYGNPCDMLEIMDIAKKYDLLVIEDCAESLGAMIGLQRVGNFGDASAVSFFANKVITTGEGGSLQINNEGVYTKAKQLRDHGMKSEQRYYHELVGYNYRLTNIQAAVGCAQLEQLDGFVKKRVEIFQSYSELFNECQHVEEQHVRPGNISANWLYTICLKGEFVGKRDLLMSYLKTKGVDSRPIFYPMNEMPAFESHIDHGEFPVSSAISYSGLSLPSSISITADEMDHVVRSVLDFFEEN